MVTQTQKRTRPAHAGFAIGAVPGDAVYTGPPRTYASTLKVLLYDVDSVQEVGLAESIAAVDKVRWVDLHGIHDVQSVKDIASAFRLHPLIVEDIVAPGQRVRIDEQEHQVVIRVRIVRPGSSAPEQATVVVGENFVLTFREGETDLFEPVRSRLMRALGRLRRSDASYLAYALLDSVVDGFAESQQELEERMTELEEQVVEDEDPHPDFPERMHELRGGLMSLRSAVSPLADAVTNLLRREHPLISAKARPYYRDLHDHLLHVRDSLESGRENARNLLDLHNSQVNQKMNQDMRVLTVVATMFIPLTFLAGVYGMNFRYIPELEWQYAYPAFWATCVLISVGLVVFFRRRGWF